nr:NAD(P)/FAD-dependent oxidoreductase [Candidatus Bathyarchaeota archaeon]
MEALNWDVAVVGCGPAGSLAALESSIRGLNVIVLEEHGKVGEPDHCAGLVSVTGLKRLGLRVPEECVLNRVYGARFYSPSGVSFSVSRRSVQALVIDRRMFDRWLASLAQSAGAHLTLKRKVTSFVRSLDGVHVHVKGGGEEKCKLLIDAEGCRARLAKMAGLPPRRGRRPAVRFEVRGVDVDPDFVELHFGGRLAPGFFAWVIPTDEGARVGLAARSHPRKRLAKFLSTRFPRAKVSRTVAGVVLTNGPVKRTFTDRFMAVGDAAGQVKPTTGGGVVTGGICSRIAGQVASEALQEERFSSGFLKRYQQRWEKILGKEFSYMKLARRVLNRLSDHALDSLFKALIEHGGTETMEAYGDMDFESAAIKKLIANPKILVKLALALLTLANPEKSAAPTA